MLLLGMIILITLVTGGVLEFPAPAPVAPAESDEEAAALVRDGRLIEAAKLYREKHGVDLLAAKNAVDKLAGS